MFKKILTLSIILMLPLISTFAQNKKAEKQALEQAKHEKAKAAIEAKLFAIVPDSYEDKSGALQTNNDEANFLAFEEDGILYLQGQILSGNKYTNKLEATTFELNTDKKGNVTLKMVISGSVLNGRIEIQMRKGSNYADVMVIPNSGSTIKFSGEVLPKSEAKYYKRPNVI